MAKKSKKRKNTASRLTQYARDEAAQLEDDECARVVAAATEHIHSRHQHQYRHRSSQKTLSVKVSCFGVARTLVSVTASVCVLDVQVRGERAITQRVPEILPADPVVTNIRGSI